jgi:hypothetical protein
MTKMVNQISPKLSGRASLKALTWMQTIALILTAALSVTGLAALGVGAQSERSPEEKSQALSRIKQAAIATLMYAGDYDDDFPYAPSTAAARKVLAPYARSQEVFHSPTPAGDFRYNLNIAGVTATAIDHPDAIPLWYEVLPGARLPVVAYVDGHAKLLTAGTRARLESALKRKFARRKGSKPIKVH